MSLSSKGRIVPWLYFDLRHLAVMKALHLTTRLYYNTHDSGLMREIWCDIYLGGVSFS